MKWILTNQTNAPLLLQIEPVGDVLEIAPNQKALVEFAKENNIDELEIELKSGKVILFAWVDGILDVSNPELATVIWPRYV